MGSLAGDVPPAEGYLFMTNSRPTSADSNFEFQFTPKVRKGEDDMSNSVEMRPMLNHSPVVSDSNHVEQQQHVNGFSNPNYANPPVIKCSDLDDLPLSPKKTPIGNLYVNIGQSPTIQEDDEPHYVNPKNNARIVWYILHNMDSLSRFVCSSSANVTICFGDFFFTKKGTPLHFTLVLPAN